MERLALLSVSDKTGLVPFAQGLVALGFTLLSTGGTARALREAGVPVTGVSAYTGAPEVFGGRVKTLHPRVHGGILGRRGTDDAEAAAHDVRWIDVVAVNLYPFEAAVTAMDPNDPEGLAKAVEQIDVGGPTMVRAAAKNHAHVAVVCDPADYDAVLAGLAEGSLGATERGRLAVKAFRHTAAYDGLISTWLGERLGVPAFEEGALPLRRVQGLRYGENPHQQASFYADPAPRGRSLARVEQLQGKELSFNNLADLDATLRACFDLPDSGVPGAACVIVKHMNPCGAAVHAEGPAAAFGLALSADPVSAFGGIVAFDRPLSDEDVREVLRSKVFFEVLAAPGLGEEGLALLGRHRPNLRVMRLPEDWRSSRPAGQDGRRVQGGWLLQDWDLGAPVSWTVASRRAPSPEEDATLRFAWVVSRAVKSNAIVLARAEGGGFVLNGVGAGQMSRVDSVRLAVSKATRAVEGSVLASDAFFPFPDGVEVARDAGVRAVVQPGGSVRDAEVFAAADAGDVAMVLTGARHFRH